MLAGQGAASQRVTLIAPQTPQELKALGLPKQLTVRFVRVLLETGEYEVLVTRYSMRWNIRCLISNRFIGRDGELKTFMVW